MFNTNRMSSEITNYNAKDDNTLSQNQSHMNQVHNQQNSRINDDTSSLQSYQIQQPLTQRIYNNKSEHSSNVNNSQTVGLESFYLTSNVKVLIGLNNYELEQEVQEIQLDSIQIDTQQQSVNLNFNQNLYKQYQFYHTFNLDFDQKQVFDLTLSQSLQSDAIGNQVTTVLTYGQKSTGKSQILGTLFETQQPSLTLIYQTLNHIFQTQLQQDGDTNYEVNISCYEVFLETLCDLFDETNEEFQTENDVTWLPVYQLDQAEQLLKMAFLNRKQIVDENGLSFSQSHLIVNIRVIDQVSECQGNIYSFIDLVGFDEEFTEKIMNGNSFTIHNETMINQQDDEDDERLQRVIRQCNDNNLFQIRNLLLAIENEKDSNIQQVLEEATLSRVIFAKLLQSNNFFVIGTLNKQQQHFNESLNTLEFCTKFQQALMNLQQNMLPVVKESSLQYYTQEENMIATEESNFRQRGALPQEISAYLDCNVKQMNMSRFYQPQGKLNNQSQIQNKILSESLYARTIHKQTNNKKKLNQSNHISMNSTKMLKYLDKFLYRQTYGQSDISQNMSHINPNILKSRNNQKQTQKQENAIKIQNEFLLDYSQIPKPMQLGMAQIVKNSSKKNIRNLYQQQSERSTGFATNTQITHLRKYSQDFMAGGGTSCNNILNPNKQQSISQQLQKSNIQRNIMPYGTMLNEQGKYQPQIIEKTFSELNFNESKTQDMYQQNNTSNNQVFNLKHLNNYSKIHGNNNKSKFDSSFLSTFINQGANNLSKMMTLNNNHQNQQVIQDTLIDDQNIILEEENSFNEENKQQVQDQIQIQMAINQFKQAKDVIAQAVNQRSRSQLKSRMRNFTVNQQQNQSSKIQGQNHQQSSLMEQQNVSKATLFVSRMIQESMKSLDVQMKDFTNFFIKDKTDDNCFVCKTSNSNNILEGNFQDIFKQKKARFFDLDKVLKDIEMKELRHQTIQSISNSSNQKYHKKNTKSTAIQPSQSKHVLDIPKPKMRPQQKIEGSQLMNKENFLTQQMQGQQLNHQSTMQNNKANSKMQTLDNFNNQSLNQNQKPLTQTYDRTILNSQRNCYNPQLQLDDNTLKVQDQNALNEILTIINNSIDTRRHITKTTNNI
eukprot:403348912